MATKLGIFNEALSDLGNRSVVDTGEASTAGRTLVERWPQVVADCLAEASWNFAMEDIKAVADTGVTPEFGYKKVFAKPSDWVNTVSVSEDEYYSIPLINYVDDDVYWSSDNSPIYIRYVSDDTGKGMDLARWTPLFRRYVELELAVRCSPRLTQSKTLKADLKEERDTARKNARAKDAMNEAQPKFAPPGRWTTSRGGRFSRGEGGNRNRLIG